MSYIFQPLGDAQPQAMALIDQVFGSGRYAKTAERLREEHTPLPQSWALYARHHTRGQVLCATLLWYGLQANASGMLRGSATLNAAAPLILLGPMAVATDYQQQGLGRELLTHALQQAQQTWRNGLIVLVGHPRYYGDFGFTTQAVNHLHLPGAVDRNRFLGLPLQGF